MLGVALLVFREVMEAALIVSIVCAATRDVARRGWFVTAGIGLGVAGALLVAMGADLIARFASGSGQEIFNACVLLSAVVMIGWHVVWMSKHGRESAQHMDAIGSAVRAGSSSLTLLLAVVAIAVLREGSEVVLFIYGMAIGGIGAAGLTGGIALGVGSGALLGFALYFGLLRIPMKHFFKVTNWMLVLLASGLASTAARFLVQGNLLPSWGTQVWDTSWLLSNGSLAGQTLGILIGYDASPAGIQLVFYATTLLLLVVSMRRLGRASPSPSPRIRSQLPDPTTESLR
ncbi:Iron permease [Thiomonas sp. X19]|uniref:FTR1 family iron permease n=1 Tax=Thiomonas sp. X19 TaxID=1050370 RepID=UPI000B6DD979|nr:FTR1 family protein [Thiomonas sp. X19]SCC94004.1 Iron permease [Thiomonas sp. X19]